VAHTPLNYQTLVSPGLQTFAEKGIRVAPPAVSTDLAWISHQILGKRSLAADDADYADGAHQQAVLHPIRVIRVICG